MAISRKKKRNIALGALATAAAAGAAAGYYYFYASDHAKAHRRKTAKWASDMKREVVRQAKKLESSIDKETLAAIVDRAASTYASMKSIDTAELARVAEELKDNWRLVAKEAKARAVRKMQAQKRRGKKTGARPKNR
jgi:hypothetical protein